MPEQPIHIAALVPYPVYPAKMGGQKGIALFYKYLSDRLPVTVISTKNNEPATSDGIHFMPVLGNSKWRYINPFLFFIIKKIIKKERFTHLILEHPYYGWLALLLKWFTGVKLVVHSHNIEALRFKSMGKWWWGILWNYERFTHRKAHCSFFIHDDDRQYGIEKFGLDPRRCITVTYGIEIDRAPSPADKQACRTVICKSHGIGQDEKILLFNGTLNYKPNQDALDIILEKINPLLLAGSLLPYKIIICGNKLPDKYKSLDEYHEKHLIYAGFVDDISVYFKGADIFINPVTDGGGIKTKVVEALGADLSVISSRSGAIGIPADITGDKMKVIADNDWEEFASEIRSLNTNASLPQSFFEHFYWGNIAAKAAEWISRSTVK